MKFFKDLKAARPLFALLAFCALILVGGAAHASEAELVLSPT